MEFAFALPLLLLPLLLPVMAGYIAKRFGRKFWVWFLISIPLPLISCFILVCLPDKSVETVPVENDEIYKNLNGVK